MAVLLLVCLYGIDHVCNPRRSVSDLASSEKTDEPPAASEWEIGMAIWVPGASAVWARRALPRVGDGRAGGRPARGAAGSVCMVDSLRRRVSCLTRV